MTPEQRRRTIRKAELAVEARVEDIVIENYDRNFKSPGDIFDKQTKIKLHGFHDYEKCDEWKNVMHRTLKRRLERKK